MREGAQWRGAGGVEDKALKKKADLFFPLLLPLDSTGLRHRL